MSTPRSARPSNVLPKVLGAWVFELVPMAWRSMVAARSTVGRACLHKACNVLPDHTSDI